MMANYHEARIPLELVHTVFGHTKSIPAGLLMPEVQECEFNVLSDGSAWVSWQVRASQCHEVALHIPADQVLDCIAHSNLAYVESGGVSVPGIDVVFDLTGDFVRNLCWDGSPRLVMSYICLFGTPKPEQ